MACNEDSDPNNDDDRHIHREHPSSPSNASSYLAWLITLNQEGSFGDGVSAHYEVH
jgi:hypothetical protein